LSEAQNTADYKDSRHATAVQHSRVSHVKRSDDDRASDGNRASHANRASEAAADDGDVSADDILGTLIVVLFSLTRLLFL